MYSIWTEKYRPKEFEDVVGQPHIVERLKAFAESKKLPHLLFAGPAGSGKSTVALIVASKLFGQGWKSNFLETNASDERGIQVVRSKIKDFARTKSIGDVPYKIIFLDEADALTSEAQQALRRTMETYSETCRFILSVNYSNRIIEPIQSRCAVFRFKAVPPEDIASRVRLIAEKEGLEIDVPSLDGICKLADGDMRKAINLLQAAASIAKGRITEKVIYETAAQARPQQVKSMLNHAVAGNFMEARSILLELLLKQGVTGTEVLNEITEQIYELEVPELQKVGMIEKVGEAEYRLGRGGSEQIQLESLLAQFALIRKR